MHILLLFILLNKWVYTPNDVALPSFVNVLHSTDKVGLVEFNGTGECIVVHRGTWSIVDLMRDLESEVDHECVGGFLEPFHESYVHDYNMDRLIEENRCEFVHYTGHSLGGVTCRMAAEFATHDVPIDSVVTYGEPRACCDGPRMIQALRVVNGLDPIPTLPDHVEHCSPKVLDLVTRFEQDDIDYPRSLPKHPLYRLYANHRVKSYEKSVWKYINKITNRLNQLRYES